jgi:hypothetical protein
MLTTVTATPAHHNKPAKTTAGDRLRHSAPMVAGMTSVSRSADMAKAQNRKPPTASE